jgi:hypothetical protein
VTSSPAIWASVSDGDAIKQSHGKGSWYYCDFILEAVGWCWHQGREI